MNLQIMSVKGRLYGGMLATGVLLIVVGGLGLAGTHQSNAALRRVHEENLNPTEYISTIAQRTRDVALVVDKAIISGDHKSKAQARSSIKEIRKVVLEAWEKYQAVPKGNHEAELARRLWEKRQEFVRVDDNILEAFSAGQFDEARRIRLEELEPATVALNAAAGELIDWQAKQADESASVADARYARDRILILGAILFGLALSAVFGVLLVRSITNSLDTAVLVSKRIAEGHLGHDIQVTSNDELGQLLGSLRSMDRKLLEVVRSVHGSAQSVGGAAAQLSSGNDDLSQRTQEQAAAIEETAASMEEMTSTVRQNADNAVQANQSAADARKQAESGGEIVTRAIEAMQQISDSSQRVSDIISVIDEIAFQTNLLALNAAVEAARAGELGRGFAVVATEVRTLAQRSAAAAKETKDLINNSVERVGVGSRLVSESGQALEAITASVKNVSDIISEIAAASQEQSGGIDQVSRAITQMDTTTQQNAALVEQAAAAAKSMQQQSEELIEQISFFNVAGAPTQAEHTPARPRAMVTALPAKRPARSLPSARHASSTPERSAPLAKASNDSAAWQEF